MRRALVLLLVLPLLLAPPLARAQDSPRPRLGDHDFVVVTAIAEPFIDTHIQTTLSVGMATNSEVPVFDINDSISVQLAPSDLMIAALAFAYQHAVKDWLAVKLDLLASGRLGTSTTTLLAEGVTGAVGYNLGWLMRIHRSRSVMVSGSVGLGTYNATFVNLLEWAEGVISGNEVPLSRARNSVLGFGGVHAAWGMSRRFGMLGSVVMNYGESFDGFGENAWNNDARLAFSYDAAVDLKLPLGVALAGGRFERNEGTESDAGIWFWSVRLAHHGRDDFTIGINVQQAYGKNIRDGSDLNMAIFSIDMRYFY